eukprot:1330281-Prymnesium_polylepis.2
MCHWRRADDERCGRVAPRPATGCSRLQAAATGHAHEASDGIVDRESGTICAFGGQKAGEMSAERPKLAATPLN